MKRMIKEDTLLRGTQSVSDQLYPDRVGAGIPKGRFDLQTDDTEDDDEDIEGEDVGNTECKAQDH